MTGGSAENSIAIAEPGCGLTVDDARAIVDANRYMTLASADAEGSTVGCPRCGSRPMTIVSFSGCRVRRHAIH